MLVELIEEFSFEDSLLAKHEPKLIDAGMLEDVEIDILDFFFVEIVLNHVQHLLVLEDLLVAVEDLDVLPKHELVRYFQLLKVVLCLVLLRYFLNIFIVAL